MAVGFMRAQRCWESAVQFAPCQGWAGAAQVRTTALALHAPRKGGGGSGGGAVRPPQPSAGAPLIQGAVQFNVALGERALTRFAGFSPHHSRSVGSSHAQARSFTFDNGR